jgi:two-component system, OmpR family, response regulator MprA
MRILIADDDRPFCDLLARLVRACNHEVADIVTAGGLAVIQSFARHRPDVVFLDILMPRFNGLTVCHALLSRDPSAKVILMSGMVDHDHPFVIGCKAAGYLSKPMLMEDVREVLDSIAGSEMSAVA